MIISGIIAFIVLLFFNRLSTISPLLLIVGLVCSTLILGLLIRFMRKWIFLILIIVYVGGIMVLFSYIVSLTENKKIIISGPSWKVILIFFILICSTRPYVYNQTLTRLYTLMEYYVFIFFSVYLILILLTVTKITKREAGGIKSIFKYDN